MRDNKMSAQTKGARWDAAKAVLSRVSDIAVLPHVVYRIVEAGAGMQDEDIEMLVAIDPGFASKVLMLANSVHYNRPAPVVSIHEATALLGAGRLRELARTISAFDLFVGKADDSSLRRRTWWRHALDTARCAEGSAEILGVDSGEAYTCGLLHDAGKPLLEKYGIGNYAAVESLVAEGHDHIEAECKVYGCSHADVGLFAAQLWRFPQKLADSIGYHHFPPKGIVPPLVAATCLANECAHQLVSGRSGASFQFSHWAIEALSLGESEIDQMTAASKRAIAVGSSLSA
jgi:putative nucleotidyltransferase with HDIG domain